MTGKRSEKNILLHEFIGLEATIVDSPCESYLNKTGEIIDESMKTFTIEYLESNK